MSWAVTGRLPTGTEYCQVGSWDQWQTNLADSRMTLFLADEAGRIVSRRIVDALTRRGRGARERLIADGLLRAAVPPALVAKEIEQSWRRSVSSHIDPEAGPADRQYRPGVWGDGEAALRDGRGVIVVGGEKLSSESRERLDDFARLPRPDAAPGARVILTERTPTGSLEYGADVGPVSVRVRSLADLHGELLDVVREVHAELFPYAPAPRFSPAALQGLLAWPWSGNVAEFTRVLAGLPEEARSGVHRDQGLAGLDARGAPVLAEPIRAG